METLSFALLALFGISCTVGQIRSDLGNVTNNDQLCSSIVTNCSDCLQNPECSWCADRRAENDTQSRCKSRFLDGECMFNVTLIPSKSQSSEGHKYISPKSIKASVRRNKPVRFNLTYIAKNYPVDLYILMDLSASMEKHRKKLVDLGSKIAKEMENITEDFRLGFGSFIDKPVLPYTRTLTKNESKTIAEPYLFKHHLKLTGNAKRFERKVNETRNSNNTDNPEGGLEALVQAIVCNEIGWRNSSRKIIILATDDTYHSAGAGKLAGILVPNDLKCHLSKIQGQEEYIYDWWDKHDYPSVVQVNSVASEYRTTVIFAATVNKSEVYTRLAAKIEGASVGNLTDNSESILEIIKQQYKKITGTVKLQDEDRPEHISLRYFAKCDANDDFHEKDFCDNVKTNQKLEFEVEVTLTNCERSDGDKNYTFAISPVGVQEKVEVEITSMCRCPCEQEEEWEVNSASCRRRGNLVCGICNCGSSYSGNVCECSASEIGNKGEQCKGPNDETECGGRGDCICGKCQCKSRYSGPYCQCDNESCLRANGELCSGKSRGTCRCGTCDCFSGWTGDICDCPTSTDNCRRPGSSQICSGKGECKCNKCSCFTNDEGTYKGAYCEQCPGCSDDECSKYEYSLYCSAFNDSPRADVNCSEFQPRLNFTWSNSTDTKPGETLCHFVDKYDCTFSFIYSNLTYRLVEVRGEKRECPKPADLMTIAGSTVAGTLVVGLALILIWRLLTYLHDKKEYAKFEEERAKAKWTSDSNPIYLGPSSEFKNPAYNPQ